MCAVGQSRQLITCFAALQAPNNSAELSHFPEASSFTWTSTFFCSALFVVQVANKLAAAPAELLRSTEAGLVSQHANLSLCIAYAALNWPAGGEQVNISSSAC
jgi:hypothetical protein